MSKIKAKKKRLFLFAGYDPHGVVDAAETMYVRALGTFGDVVYVMDADAPKSEISKIEKIPGVIYAAARKHGEYDFGSYRRGYEYARDAGILGDYEFVYMVNNSVYGPLGDMTPMFEDMENSNADAFGPATHPSSAGTYIQSWFIGMRSRVFLSDWFDAFITSVRPQDSKGAVIALYERGFTRRLTENGGTFYGVWSCPGRSIYNGVRRLYRAGMPFVKRGAFNRRSGALGRQLCYVLRHVDAATRDAILDNARRTLGDVHIRWLLTRNPLRIAYRNIAHSMKKLFIEGI